MDPANAYGMFIMHQALFEALQLQSEQNKTLAFLELIF